MDLVKLSKIMLKSQMYHHTVLVQKLLQSEAGSELRPSFPVEPDLN